MTSVGNNKISRLMNSSIQDISSTTMRVSGARGTFGSEPNRVRPRRYWTRIFQRTIRIFGSQQRSEDIQKINYMKKISSAIKKEKWRALDERLNKAIASGMSLKKLRSIIKKIQTFKIKSEDRTYKLDKSLNEVFLFAVDYGQVALVKVLLKIGFASPKITHDMRPLDYASNSGNVEITKLLLFIGFDINMLSTSPLAAAISQRNVDMVKLLLSNGADANMYTEPWTLPLYKSIVSNQPNITMLLLELGKADPNFHIPDHPSPLMKAVMQNNVGAVELLLRNKADVNGQFNGESILKCALRLENIHTAACLILAGATSSSDDEKNYYALLATSGYDNKKECPLSLNSLSFREINTYFHVCKSIDERKEFATKIGIPFGLRQPFIFGLKQGNFHRNLDGKIVDVSSAFYIQESRFADIDAPITAAPITAATITAATITAATITAATIIAATITDDIDATITKKVP